MNISIIIPTYKEPEYLDLCLQSIIDNSISNQDFLIQVIIVVDGFFDINKHILAKYKSTQYIEFNTLIFDENVGLAKGTNTGVQAAKYPAILIVNDDNVFSPNWNQDLPFPQHGVVYSLNQIEPLPSMFTQFDIKDFGKTAQEFAKEAFNGYAMWTSWPWPDNTGSTLPIFINKKTYLAVGGWDEDYPGPWVVDWDFFLKCKINNYKMVRLYESPMYHFAGAGTKLINKVDNNRLFELCHEYAKYKWGDYIQHNPINNEKFLK